MLVTMKSEELNNAKTQLFWELEMHIEKDEIFSDMKKNIEQVYVMSAQRLEEIVNS